MNQITDNNCSLWRHLNRVKLILTNKSTEKVYIEIVSVLSKFGFGIMLG